MWRGLDGLARALGAACCCWLRAGRPVPVCHTQLWQGLARSSQGWQRPVDQPSAASLTLPPDCRRRAHKSARASGAPATFRSRCPPHPLPPQLVGTAPGVSEARVLSASPASPARCRLRSECPAHQKTPSIASAQLADAQRRAGSNGGGGSGGGAGPRAAAASERRHHLALLLGRLSPAAGLQLGWGEKLLGSRWEQQPSACPPHRRCRSFVCFRLSC